MRFSKGILFALALLLAVSCKQDDRPFVVSKIKSAAKLATTETTIDKIVLATESKRFIRWLGGRKQAVFLAYTQATIQTGIDLDKLEEGDITISDQTINLKLPPVEVLNFSYPAESFRIDTLLTYRTVFDNISIEEQEELYRQAEIDIRNNLKYLGIKTVTEDKTRALMQGLLSNLGFQEIYISFKDGPLIYEIDLTGEQDAKADGYLPTDKKKGGESKE